MNRRHFLTVLGSSFLVGSQAEASLFGAKRHLHVFRQATGEVFSGTMARGHRFDRGAMDEFAWFARDTNGDVVHPFDPNVVNTLLLIGEGLSRSEPTHVLSAYRTPATNSRIRSASNRSLHMQGMALDIRHPEAGYTNLARLADRVCPGGLGRYGRRGFVHIDCGAHRRW